MVEANYKSSDCAKGHLTPRRRKNRYAKLYTSKYFMSIQIRISALAQGVEGIMVSNHGARQLDGVQATIDALEDIIEVVNKINPKVEVYLDGGIREGTDVLKALALGAKMVFIGRPVLWGLAFDGQAGVDLTLEILRKELDLAMALSGKIDVTKIDRDLVKTEMSML